MEILELVEMFDKSAQVYGWAVEELSEKAYKRYYEDYLKDKASLIEEIKKIRGTKDTQKEV